MIDGRTGIEFAKDEKDKREMLEQLAKSLGCSHMLKNDSVSDRVDSVDFSEPKASAS